MCTTVTPAQTAQSSGRQFRPGAGETPEHPAIEIEKASQEGGAPAGMLDVLDRQKTAIVGSWLGKTARGDILIYTYNADGTVHGSVQGEVSTDPELGVTSPTHGVWQHLGGRQFGVTHMGLFYDINTGALTGYLKIRVVLTLNEAGDEMSGIDKVQLLDTDGNVVDTFPPGNTPYKRIKFEPFN